MTPEDQKIILSLVHAPEHPPTATPDDILRHFSESDGKKLGLRLISSAVAEKSADDLELSLIVANLFGFDSSHLDVLIQLASDDWHHQHEDIVVTLGSLGSPKAVDVLLRSTRWAPEYMVDDGAALARKAVYALGKIPGPESEAALVQLAESDEEVLRRTAKKLLSKREIS
ncbi:HEAT repeat domain-containing protein [Nocardia nova]|uniref:HEAT repeat domain-containing protein n=1 Tax=Nocardia nova TaxID=37330 RepID=UPI0033F524ED